MSEIEIRTVGIIGAGQMGSGIAQVAAQAGFKVRICDVSTAIVENAKAKMAAILGKQVDKGKLTAEARATTLENISAVESASGFGGCQLVVEAATESFDLKVALIRRADEALAPGAILATNTSSISITKLAAATSRPDHVVGMHFFNPPPLMKLVELVRGVQTSDATFGAARRAAEAMGKTVVTSHDSPGFLVNRMLIPMINEAVFTLQEGVGTADDIDSSAKLGLNHPLGPLELADLIGLDTCLAIADVLHREFGDSKYRAPSLLRNLVAAGWVGRKSGRGFYAYDKGQKTTASTVR